VHNSASDAMVIADFAESFGKDGFSVTPGPPYDFVGMNWAAGRRCTDIPDPGPDTSQPQVWQDGYPIEHGPHTPIAWRALVARHGVPARAATPADVGWVG